MGQKKNISCQDPMKVVLLQNYMIKRGVCCFPGLPSFNRVKFIVDSNPEHAQHNDLKRYRNTLTFFEHPVVVNELKHNNVVNRKTL